MSSRPVIQQFICKAHSTVNEQGQDADAQLLVKVHPYDYTIEARLFFNHSFSKSGSRVGLAQHSRGCILCFTLAEESTHINSLITNLARQTEAEGTWLCQHLADGFDSCLEKFHFSADVYI